MNLSSDIMSSVSSEFILDSTIVLNLLTKTVEKCVFGTSKDALS